jgi:exodeoxyribonuclease VII large subunit
MPEAGVRDPIPNILTVSALNQIIRFRLEEVFTEVWVEGEISNLRVPSSGHCYFTLKDEASQIRGVIFRSTGSRLKFTPEDGLHVLCRARLTVYEPRGEYQLLVEKLEPRGIGALQLAFEQLKEKLRKEGLFDPVRKRPLPAMPKRIGVVTSPTGAAIRDILKVLHGRFADVSVLIHPVPVQGEGAAAAIAGAIRELNDRKDTDVLIVGRGGGSLEDLWAFNEEVVARAIADSGIPVISAVGHEIDYTISDWVADVRAPTPSAAAEMVIERKTDLLRRVSVAADRMAAAVKARLESVRTALQYRMAALRDPRRAVQTHFPDETRHRPDPSRPPGPPPSPRRNAPVSKSRRPPGASPDRNEPFPGATPPGARGDPEKQPGRPRGTVGPVEQPEPAGRAGPRLQPDLPAAGDEAGEGGPRGGAGRSNPGPPPPGHADVRRFHRGGD